LRLDAPAAHYRHFIRVAGASSPDYRCGALRRILGSVSQAKVRAASMTPAYHADNARANERRQARAARIAAANIYHTSLAAHRHH